MPFLLKATDDPSKFFHTPFWSFRIPEPPPVADLVGAALASRPGSLLENYRANEALIERLREKAGITFKDGAGI